MYSDTYRDSIKNWNVYEFGNNPPPQQYQGPATYMGEVYSPYRRLPSDSDWAHYINTTSGYPNQPGLANYNIQQASYTQPQPKQQSRFMQGLVNFFSRLFGSNRRNNRGRGLENYAGITSTPLYS